MRHGTDDLVITCTSCDRIQIEEDPSFFHCQRFGCCYDLCLVCAEGLVRHRRGEAAAAAAASGRRPEYGLTEPSIAMPAPVIFLD
mmetsp:Transcript_70206/g.116281  ORF Transcript_70206/g.116281 Transcript_70206/m.116281 type:complete len:85 (-) Transcript_70206:15-269(-)